MLAIQAIAQMLFSSRDQNQRINRRLTMLASGMSQSDVYSELVRRPPLPAGTDPSLVRLYERFARYCQQAGLQTSPLRIIAYILSGGVALWLISLLFVRNTEISGIVTNSTFSLLASFTITALVAIMWLNILRAGRLRALEGQMPLSLDVINRALRAGHPVVSAVQLAANEMGDPIGSEFGLIVDETTYGFEFKDALVSFARRTGSPDAHFFAVSVGIQSETGGNLAEILEGLAQVMRSRATLGKKVKSLASEGKASAYLLSALPVLLVAFFLLTEPEFYTEKFSDPIFWPTVGAIVVLYLVGVLMIRRIINFRY